jgi:hypothetical protein
MGLKNSIAILPEVSGLVGFAVNEECSVFQECGLYSSFLQSNKPVFHIEYPSLAPIVNATEMVWFCNASGTTGMSTVLKDMHLDGWIEYCNGSQYNTSVGNPGSNHWGSSSSLPYPTATSSTSTRKPSTTVKPSTTSKPTTTTKTTSTKPTSSSSSASGCPVAHWGQCGGTYYTGCTVCVVSHLHSQTKKFPTNVLQVRNNMQRGVTAVVLPVSLSNPRVR